MAHILLMGGPVLAHRPPKSFMRNAQWPLCISELPGICVCSDRVISVRHHEVSYLQLEGTGDLEYMCSGNVGICCSQ